MLSFNISLQSRKRDMKDTLIYQGSASSWYEALPLGSGSLGAMMEGREEDIRIGLNLDTLWSGYAKDKINPSRGRDLSYFRKLLEQEDYAEAEEYAKAHYLGDWTECYLPAGYLLLHLGEKNTIKRELHLSEALYEERFELGASDSRMRSFIHYHKDILCVEITAQERCTISLDLQSQLQSTTRLHMDERLMVLQGTAPVYAAPNYYPVENPIRYGEEGMKYALALRWEIEDGEVWEENRQLHICAKKVYLYLSGETGFYVKENVLEAAIQKLDITEKSSFEALYNEHKSIFSPLYHRVDIDLGGEDTDTISSLCHRDNHIYELMFQYARYLLLTSSKEGTQAANLQGIWNDILRAPWSSNYTVNINTQMNYWFAEGANLSECHMPLFDLLDRTVKNGEETAEKLYGLEGFVSHHNIDLWGHSTPVGLGSVDAHPSVYSMWNMSGAWLCRHLTDHYRYTKDLVFLRERAFPVIEKAVKFFVGYVYEYQGYMVTAPSTSPENLFLDKSGDARPMSIASTMDITILKELFANYLEICDILHVEKDNRVEVALAKLPPFQIGKHGQLQEWFFDYEEEDVNHRHVSHLYGLYPGDILLGDEKLLQAARVSLQRREDEGTGWCIAWKACLFARLRDGDRALELLNKQLRLTREERILTKGGGTYANLFCAHPPFQIDGNFGFAAAMLEMLIYSRDGEVYLLPALPAAWKSGKVKGLKLIGNYEIDFAWEDYAVKKIVMRANSKGQLRVHYNSQIKDVIFDDTLECIL